jgi:Domain of unknown function (DUF5642)
VTLETVDGVDVAGQRHIPALMRKVLPGKKFQLLVVGRVVGVPKNPCAHSREATRQPARLVISTGMRPCWIGPVATPLVALLAVACAQSPAPSKGGPPKSAPTTSAHATTVNPANIKRVSRELPPGYEVTTGIPSGVSPRSIFGLGADATAKPPQCATLADPGNGRDQSAQGVSGSGTGGIVDAVVVALQPGPATLDHDVVASCGQWTMAAEHDTVSLHLIDAPHIDGAETIGIEADIRTTVESGSEIDSRTYTFIAYLGDYYAFTTLTTDPGSLLPALTPQFAADLLAKTVSTLRG